ASYEVLASFGHVRDLPAKNGSVDPDANFQMIWEIDPKAAGRLNDIAKALKGADRLILATDPDREGEAISWHVLEVLKEKRAPKDSRRGWSAPTARRFSASTLARARKPKISRKRLSRPASRLPASRQGRRGAIRRRRSPPRHCSRKPAANSVLRRRTPCGSRSGSMKASISAARPPV